MTLMLRRLVSQNRRRYVSESEGLDLDLTYILPNLIAMGFPAENYERWYRNNISDVVRFFELRHSGHYRIYNLCSERSYDPARFQHNVVVYPFEDHQPPCISLIKSCVEDIHNWLSADPENVAAVHCKAGKGRTGLIICSYLLHSHHVPTPEDALAFYGEARTMDSHGVTIPSQQRYIRYYYRLLQSGVPYRELPLALERKEMINGTISEECPYEGLIFGITQHKKEVWTSEVLPIEPSYNKSAQSEIRVIELSAPLVVCGDVLVECYGVRSWSLFSLTSFVPKREKIFQFWFNTFFVDGQHDGSSAADRPHHLALAIARDHMDLLTKDKQWRYCSCSPSIMLEVLGEKIQVPFVWLFWMVGEVHDLLKVILYRTILVDPDFVINFVLRFLTSH